VPLVVKLVPVALNVPELEQSPPEVLLATIEFLMFSVLKAELKMPPPTLSTAEFPDIVVKLMFAVPPVCPGPELLIPAPGPVAEFPDSVQLVIVNVPPKFLMPAPPPPPVKRLLESVLLVIVTMPPLL
jgi:hypothetical protein